MNFVCHWQTGSLCVALIFRLAAPLKSHDLVITQVLSDAFAVVYLGK